MIPIDLLKNKEFISVATCNNKAEPNAAPKMILEIKEKFLYLLDYTCGKTWENLQINPKISMSFSDSEELKGYQINGSVEILQNNDISFEILKKIDERKLSLSVERVIRGVRNDKKHKSFEIEIPDKFVVYKVKVEEVTEIGPQGDLQRKKIV